MIKILVSDVCHAFDPGCVGTRVLDHKRLIGLLEAAVAACPFESYQAIPLPVEACDYVSCGVGRRCATDDPGDFVLREHRGRVDAYLRRSNAARAESVTAIVYTVSGYLKDPDTSKEEYLRVLASGATHVIVALLASSGPKPPLGVYRFVANLGGGNMLAQVWTGDEIRTMAGEVIAYDREWCVVAD